MGASRIEDESRIFGMAWLSGEVIACGRSQVHGMGRLCDTAIVCGDTVVCGDMVVCGESLAYD